MNINWKLRLQNRTVATSIAASVITCVYGVLAALGVTPSVTQEQVTNWAVAAIGLLTAVGALVDPTTAGVSDSAQAMSYDEPRADDEMLVDEEDAEG